MLKHKDLLQEFQSLVLSAPGPKNLMDQMAHRLHQEMTRYSWIGFFLLSPANPKLLVLGPYAGSLSPQFSISVDEGLCGAAITGGKTIVVDDVANDPRYSAVMEMTKSEIVVPIFVHKKVIGEIDINSYFLKTFTPPERAFVESCAAIVGGYFENNSCTIQDVVGHQNSGRL
jgi:L-methionine (R)-S-oxide reductase